MLTRNRLLLKYKKRSPCFKTHITVEMHKRKNILGQHQRPINQSITSCTDCDTFNRQLETPFPLVRIRIRLNLNFIRISNNSDPIPTILFRKITKITKHRQIQYLVFVFQFWLNFFIRIFLRVQVGFGSASAKCVTPGSKLNYSGSATLCSISFQQHCWRSLWRRRWQFLLYISR